MADAGPRLGERLGVDDQIVRETLTPSLTSSGRSGASPQELPEQLAAKLMAAGVTGSLAHQTAEIFAERAQARQTISYAANVNLVCKNVTTMVDLLSKSSTKWKRSSNGGVQFTSKAPFEQYNAAAIEMNSAVKALNGG